MRSFNLHITILLIALGTSSYAQRAELSYDTLFSGLDFYEVVRQIEDQPDALYVFDIDNTLLVSNDNKFGSDWWYAQTEDHPGLKLHVNSSCLFDVLTPMFYAMFSTTELFDFQAQLVEALSANNGEIMALTARGYSPSVATSTELQLTKNNYSFLNTDSMQLSADVVLLNNVIYTKGGDKGKVLYNFIQDQNFKRIYFFDDTMKNVVNVKNAFTDKGIDISLYYMDIAPKIPYTKEEMDFMQEELCNLINTINTLGATSCSCNQD